MSNQNNTIICENAVEFVDRMMANNPTIPEEARLQLELDTIRMKMEETIEGEGEEFYE